MYPSFRFLSIFSVVSRDKNPRVLFLFFKINIKSGRLAGIRWSVCISKSRRSFIIIIIIYSLEFFTSALLLLLLFSSFESFLSPAGADDFHWMESPLKSLGLFWIFNNAVVIMVSTRPLIFKSFLLSLGFTMLWNGQIPLFDKSSFGLADIRWSVCISKSQSILCVSFSRTYHIHILFIRMVKFKLLAQFPVDNFNNPAVSSLILCLR